MSLLLVCNLSYGSLCGSIYNTSSGPWDYSSPQDRKKILRTVERRHFTPRVENLIRGESTVEIMDDLAYTLNKFPNHYRALYSLIRYDEKLKGSLPKVAKYAFPQTVDCYFERAFQLSNQDPYVHQLYGIYLYKKAEYDKSKDSFHRAESIKPSAEIYYNLGLVHIELGNLAEAQNYAQKAYSSGFPMAGLKKKLEAYGIKDIAPKESLENVKSPHE